MSKRRLIARANVDFPLPEQPTTMMRSAVFNRLAASVIAILCMKNPPIVRTGDIQPTEMAGKRSIRQPAVKAFSHG